MRILVTGGRGQLGKELKRILVNEALFSGLNGDDGIIPLDITNKESVEQVVQNYKITHIVNCAAYTQVDKAEAEKEKAYLVNHFAVKTLAEISEKYHIRLIHISTDFVFDGNKNTPYLEEDEPNPLSVYGDSKLAGERALITKLSNFVIIRTSWLYSKYGNNFVKTILKYSKERGYLRVVYDQVGTPTYAKDLAEIIVKIIPMDEIKGVYHYSNEGVSSWYDFAKGVVEFGSIKCRIEPILSIDYPTLAKRPNYSVLSKTKIKRELGIEIPYWRDSLEKCIKVDGIEF
ncbi:MAG: dTDP-4-dehydrorhamnose reductase [Candidatus Omnitrophica bacterium]|nr:dTDP-4-dehydrorhamnose reductase [Candidatus Omnitrophota bacterium]